MGQSHRELTGVTLAAAKLDTCYCVSLHLHKCQASQPQVSLSPLNSLKASLNTQK